MSMTPEDLQALSEARGRPLTAPARDFTAEIAAAYAPKEAAYGTIGSHITTVFKA
jgi:hypothetical protein